MHKKILQIEGQQLAIIESGKGKPLFFLHGWGGSKESWERLINELDKLDVLNGHRVVAVDFPGFGESDEPDTAWEVQDYAIFWEKSVKEIYREFDLSGDYDLGVHSFGGRVLLKLLSAGFQHSIVEKPDKLVLIAAAGIKPRKTLRLRVAAAAAKIGKAVLSLPGLKWAAPLAQKLLYKVLKTHDYEKSNGVMRETFLKVIDEDLRDSVKHIKNPTLIFAGKKDSYVPYSDAVYMSEQILDSKLITIPDGRHGIHKTHAALLAREIKEFLKA